SSWPSAKAGTLKPPKSAPIPGSHRWSRGFGYVRKSPRHRGDVAISGHAPMTGFDPLRPLGAERRTARFETKRTLTVADMNVSEWPNWESIVIRKPLLTLMLAMIAPRSVGRNAAQAEGLAGDATLSEEMLNTPGCMRSISPVLSKVLTFRQRRIASGAKAIFAAFALFAASTRAARAEDAGS